jgi:prepilin-type N-terminal cleavage/methylation domain-containing protein
MFQTYRRVQRQRAAGEIDGGFTLIELLIVIVVLGILAAIVVFALGGVTKQSAVAACQSDAKTVGIAVGALQAENQSVTEATAAAWHTDLLGSSLTGGPFLQSWPTNTGYTITVAGTAEVTANVPAGVKYGDVIVAILSPAATNNGTTSPVAACINA